MFATRCLRMRSSSAVGPAQYKLIPRASIQQTGSVDGQHPLATCASLHSWTHCMHAGSTMVLALPVTTDEQVGDACQSSFTVAVAGRAAPLFFENKRQQAINPQQTAECRLPVQRMQPKCIPCAAWTAIFVHTVHLSCKPPAPDTPGGSVSSRVHVGIWRGQF